MSLNQYQIINKLGSGAFGIVYKAKQKKNNQLCVIKQIQISKLDARLKKWAMNQAKLMKQINSPYIVKYFNSFIQKTKLFIAMQYCVKGDLAKYIKSQMGKPLKQQTIWKFTIQIMIGLRDLHSKKILHRDIKTLNIFLDQNFNIRVGDLGVAKTMSTDFTNTVVGTPYYLSPQMCEEKPYNQKTDIWAFGCLVYQLCTGKHPFQAQNQAALALKIVMGKFQDIPSNYSKQLRWLIQACLSVDYKRRPSINYLLQRPRIIQQARKHNIILQSPSQTKKSPEQSNLIQRTTKQQRKSLQILQIVKKATQKVQDNIKKVSKQKKIERQKQFSHNHNNRNYSERQLQVLNNNSKRSQQKRKSIDKKYGNLPPKQIGGGNQQPNLIKQQEVGKKQIKSNNNSSNNNQSRQKSKQKIVVKIPSVPPAKVVSNKLPSQAVQVKQTQKKASFLQRNQKLLLQKSNDQGAKKPDINKFKKQLPLSSKKQIIQPSQKVQKLLDKQSKSKIVQEKPTKLNSVANQSRINSNNQKNQKQSQKKTSQQQFIPALESIQKLNIKKQFNLEDEKKIKQDESLLIEDMSLLDITKVKNKDFPISEQEKIKLQKENQKSAKKNAFVSSKIQQQVDDDLLMAQFGITPQKKEVLNDTSMFSLLKTKSINWDLDLGMNSTNPNKQILNQDTKNLPSKQNLQKTMFKQLPTIKVQNQPTQQSQISVLIQKGQQNQQENDEQYNEEVQLDDNQPYKSDNQSQDEQNQCKQNKKEPRSAKKQKINQQGLQQQSQFQQDDDSRYLIQNIQAQFEAQGKHQLQNSIQLYSKKLLQNQKRLLQLQNYKSHTQKQYFSHLPKQTYNLLKQKINTQNQSQVDKLMKQLTKGKQYLVMKFLKIVGFEIQIQICQKNVAECKNKITELKKLVENKEFY